MKKTLIQFLYESGIETRMPHVYLDMDGVLVNLEKGSVGVVIDFRDCKGVSEKIGGVGEWWKGGRV